MSKREPIATCGMTNNHSLNVYEIEFGIEDQILVGINNDEPEWTLIRFQMDEETGDDRPMFAHKGADHWLDECIKL